MIRNLEAAQRATRERNFRPTKRQLQLEEEQERMRIEQEARSTELDDLRDAEFRERVVRLFMKYGRTREQAENFWLRAVFGETIAEIRRDYRTLRELRKCGFRLGQK
jgi:hypothetical protein